MSVVALPPMLHPLLLPEHGNFNDLVPWKAAAVRLSIYATEKALATLAANLDQHPLERVRQVATGMRADADPLQIAHLAMLAAASGELLPVFVKDDRENVFRIAPEVWRGKFDDLVQPQMIALYGHWLVCHQLFPTTSAAARCSNAELMVRAPHIERVFHISAWKRWLEIGRELVEAARSEFPMDPRYTEKEFIERFSMRESSASDADIRAVLKEVKPRSWPRHGRPRRPR